MTQQELLGPLYQPPTAEQTANSTFPPTAMPASSVAQLDTSTPPPTDALGQLLTGGYSALNSATLGIPDLLLKTANTPAYQAMLSNRKQNKRANDLGNVAGLVGSMFVPVGAGAELVGAGAKALGATKIAEGAGDIAKYLNSSGKIGDATGFGQLGQQALRGVAQAGSQAVPRALTDYGTTGNFDPASLALQLGAGGVLSPIAGKIGDLTKKVGAYGAEETGKSLMDTALTGLGIGTRSIKTAMNSTSTQLGLNKYGNMFNNAEPLKEDILRVANKFGVTTPNDVDKLIEDQNGLWNGVAKAYNANPADFTDPALKLKIMSDPALAPYLNNSALPPGALQASVDNLATDMTKRPDWYDANNYLAKKVHVGAKGTDELSSMNADVAHAFDRALDDQVFTPQNLADNPELASIKGDYPALKAMKVARGMERATIDNTSKDGPDTTPLALIASGLVGGLGGGGLGLATGGDPWQAAGMGALGMGGLKFLTKGPLAKMGSTVMGNLANGARNSLEEGGALNQVGKAVSPIASLVGKFAENPGGKSAIAPALVGAGIRNDQLTQPTGQTTEAQTTNFNPEEPALKAPGATPPPAPAQGPAPQNGGGVPQGMATNASMSQTQGGEQASAQAPKESPMPAQTYATPQQNPVYQKNVLGRLQSIYQNEGFNLDMTFQDFVQKVGAKTGNFDPRLMGKVFFDDPTLQEKYRKDYDVANQLKNLPIQKIIQESTQFGGGLGISSLIPLMDEDKKAEKRLKDTQLKSLVNGGKPMSEAESKAFDGELQSLSRLPKEEQIPEFMRLLKSVHGIDLNALNTLGVL